MQLFTMKAFLLLESWPKKRRVRLIPDAIILTSIFDNMRKLESRGPSKGEKEIAFEQKGQDPWRLFCQPKYGAPSIFNNGQGPFREVRYGNASPLRRTNSTPNMRESASGARQVSSRAKFFKPEEDTVVHGENRVLIQLYEKKFVTVMRRLKEDLEADQGIGHAHVEAFLSFLEEFVKITESAYKVEQASGEQWTPGNFEYRRLVFACIERLMRSNQWDATDVRQISTQLHKEEELGNPQLEAARLQEKAAGLRERAVELRLEAVLLHEQIAGGNIAENDLQKLQKKFSELLNEASKKGIEAEQALERANELAKLSSINNGLLSQFVRIIDSDPAFRERFVKLSAITSLKEHGGSWMEKTYPYLAYRCFLEALFCLGVDCKEDLLEMGRELMKSQAERAARQKGKMTQTAVGSEGIEQRFNVYRERIAKLGIEGLFIMYESSSSPFLRSIAESMKRYLEDSDNVYYQFFVFREMVNITRFSQEGVLNSCYNPGSENELSFAKLLEYERQLLFEVINQQIAMRKEDAIWAKAIGSCPQGVNHEKGDPGEFHLLTNAARRYLMLVLPECSEGQLSAFLKRCDLDMVEKLKDEGKELERFCMNSARESGFGDIRRHVNLLNLSKVVLLLEKRRKDLEGYLETPAYSRVESCLTPDSRERITKQLRTKEFDRSSRHKPNKTSLRRDLFSSKRDRDAGALSLSDEEWKDLDYDELPSHTKGYSGKGKRSVRASSEREPGELDEGYPRRRIPSARQVSANPAYHSRRDASEKKRDDGKRKYN